MSSPYEKLLRAVEGTGSGIGAAQVRPSKFLGRTLLRVTDEIDTDLRLAAHDLDQGARESIETLSIALRLYGMEFGGDDNDT
jgi:hypothetical protein